MKPSVRRRGENTAVLLSLIVSIAMIVMALLGVWLMDISKNSSGVSARILLF
jgi:hypothetical protein